MPRLWSLRLEETSITSALNILVFKKHFACAYNGYKLLSLPRISPFQRNRNFFSWSFSSSNSSLVFKWLPLCSYKPYLPDYIEFKSVHIIILHLLAFLHLCLIGLDMKQQKERLESGSSRIKNVVSMELMGGHIPCQAEKAVCWNRLKQRIKTKAKGALLLLWLSC